MSCHANYTRHIRRRLVLVTLLASALVVCALADLAVGGSRMPLGDVVRALAAGPASESIDAAILWSIRLPMTLTALFVGTALAVAGLEIQNITGNALASPSTLGISSAASFGAAAAITAGFTLFGQLWIGTALAAFVLALVVSVAVFALGRLQGMSPTSLILSGIVMNFFFMALQQFLHYQASPEIAQLISGWTFGNLERSSWTSAAAASVVTLMGFMYLLARSWVMTALTLGEERARSLGIAVGRLRAEVFFLSSLMIAAAVGFIGTVSFVGLVAPHCARLMLGEDQRFLLPATLLTGGLLMLTSSFAAKLLSTGAMLPVGIITSLVGVPFLLVLLLKSREAAR
ncbi:MAG: FecCD family ABC transporter permease [Duodenibacillus sp.]